MMGTVYLAPDAVWNYYTAHRPELLGTHKTIAENTEYGVKVFITGYSAGYLTIGVLVDGIPVYEEDAISDEDCQILVEAVYDNYLSYDAVEGYEFCEDDETREPNTPESSGETEKIIEREIAKREGELDDAVITFLETAVDYMLPYSTLLENIIDDCKEHFLRYIWQKHGLAVHRPMYLEDENKELFFEEYPYDCMIFD